MSGGAVDVARVALAAAEAALKAAEVSEGEARPSPIRRADWVAERMGIDRKRVYEMARYDLIPHIRAGQQLFFDEGRVEAWLAAGGSRKRGEWRQQAQQAS